MKQHCANSVMCITYYRLFFVVYIWFVNMDATVCVCVCGFAVDVDARAMAELNKRKWERSISLYFDAIEFDSSFHLQWHRSLYPFHPPSLPPKSVEWYYMILHVATTPPNVQCGALGIFRSVSVVFWNVFNSISVTFWLLFLQFNNIWPHFPFIDIKLHLEWLYNMLLIYYWARGLRGQCHPHQ